MNSIINPTYDFLDAGKKVTQTESSKEVKSKMKPVRKTQTGINSVERNVEYLMVQNGLINRQEYATLNEAQCQSAFFSLALKFPQPRRDAVR